MRIARVAALALLAAVHAAPPVAAGSIERITRGDRVELGDHLVPGRYVLFDFFADWCGPCRALEPHLESLAAGHGDRLEVLQVDIVRWGSPVAEQYRIRSIPHLKLFDPDGRLVAEGGAGRVLAELEARLGPTTAHPPVARGRRGGPGPALVVAVLVIAAAVLLVLSGRRRQGEGPIGPPTAPDTVDPDTDRVWFAMVQGALEGPYSPAELEQLVQRGVLAATASVRRRGDPGWRRLDELI